LAIPIYFGLRSFGRIDAAGGDYVATRFFHLYYLPLIPVGGVRGSASGQEYAGPLHLGSLALAYLKWIGFVAAAGLTALAYNALEEPGGNSGFLLGAGAIALAGLVGASWAVIGNRHASAQSKASRLLIPTLLVVAVLGWSYKERLHRQSLPSYAFAERRMAYQATHPGTSDVDYVLHQLQGVVESERTPPAFRDCSGVHFVLGRFDGRELLVAQDQQLAQLVAHQSIEPSKEWSISSPLGDLVGKYPEVAVFSVSERPYLAALGPGGARIYDLIEGKYLCGAPFASSARGEEYVEALEKVIHQLSSEVSVGFNRSWSRVD
jgi:hypothetical protein